MGIFAKNLLKFQNRKIGNYVINYKNTSPNFDQIFNYNLKESIFLLRFVRLIYYPILAFFNQNKVNHIIDHSYGNLLTTISSKKTIVTVHDLIPILAYLGKIQGLKSYFRPILFEYSIRKLLSSKFVVCVSETTKKDLIYLTGQEPSRFKVIYNGLDNHFKQFKISERINCRKKFGINDFETFNILIVGSEPYKNHNFAIEVFKKIDQLSSRPLRLIVLKGTSSLTFNIDDCDFNFPIVQLFNITDTEIVELYNSVDCLFFPSLYEGFGWPPLEAMACGVPVIASDIEIFRETLGSCALLSSPYDIDSMTNNFLELINKVDFRENLINKGLARAQHFSWDSCFDQYAKLYLKISS